VRSILNVEVECTENACMWTGTVDDCIPDVDGSGEIGCPLCMAFVRAVPPIFCPHGMSGLCSECPPGGASKGKGEGQ
jgi:hypothetical protein